MADHWRRAYASSRDRERLGAEACGSASSSQRRPPGCLVSCKRRHCAAHREGHHRLGTAAAPGGRVATMWPDKTIHRYSCSGTVRRLGVE